VGGNTVTEITEVVRPRTKNTYVYIYVHKYCFICTYMYVCKYVRFLVFIIKSDINQMNNKISIKFLLI